MLTPSQPSESIIPGHRVLCFSPQGPEKEMDAIQAKEEVNKAQEEDEDDMLMGRFSGRENSFRGFHRRNEF